MKFILLALSIILLPDIIIRNIFTLGSGVIGNTLYWAPLVIIILSLIFGFFAGIGQTFFMRVFFFLLLCTVLPKLIFLIIFLLAKGSGVFIPIIAKFANILSLGGALIVFGFSVYGFTSGWKRLTVKEVDIASEKLPESFNGYRIVQLSDLHLSTYHSSPETINKLVDMVNGLNADAMVFTGDLVNMTPDEIDPFMNVLSCFKAKDGIFSVMGNHDYCSYIKYDSPDQAKRNIYDLQQRQKEMGWDLLLNENRIIRRNNDSIAIIGVENDGRPPFPSFADIGKAISGLSDKTYKVLLSHDPTHWRREILPNTDIDLTLSGHTHSMQFRINRFSPSMWAYDEWGGRYIDGKRNLYVNSGTGSNVAFRLGAWPEITLLTLKKE